MASSLPARWGRADQFVWIEEAPLPHGIRILETPGHAPFHVSYVIETDHSPVLVAGDALLVRGEAESSLHLVPPHNLALYLESQRRIAAFDGIIIPGHDDPFENVPSPNLAALHP